MWEAISFTSISGIACHSVRDSFFFGKVEQRECSVRLSIQNSSSSSSEIQNMKKLLAIARSERYVSKNWEEPRMGASAAHAGSHVGFEHASDS